ncbi:asparaginase [Desulforamulus aquiferis]|uniref:Asparaginase n=1 Tax=Desulforamulus aquiferis TaxID=1397668 RepID=A0AAW7ZHF1_9FIRM|nr:asparaginase [Desulforamulus aquiferis]MDO7788609.1 asparaginase [Desulforamulus aquiferis]
MADLLVKVTRGSLIESQHRGHLVVCDRAGNTIFTLGNPELVTYWRSSAKPFQAIPLIERGGAERFALTGSEIAILTSSHGGEEQHVITIGNLFKKIGLSTECLNCGPSEPMYKPAAQKILTSGAKYAAWNNACSGKHSGMLMLALLLNAPLANYIDKDHPVQQEMLKVISQCSTVSPKDIVLGIDGCGVPVFGLPLRNMAMAYARLSLPEDYFSPGRTRAINLIRDAMTSNPYYVAGTDRLDTMLMEATKGKVVAKLGSEGIYCVGIVNEGIGLALKIEDGNYRAIGPVVINVLKGLGYLNDAEFSQLKHLWQPALKNHRGETIGHLEVAFSM